MSLRASLGIVFRKQAVLRVQLCRLYYEYIYIVPPLTLKSPTRISASGSRRDNNFGDAYEDDDVVALLIGHFAEL